MLEEQHGVSRGAGICGSDAACEGGSGCQGPMPGKEVLPTRGAQWVGRERGAVLAGGWRGKCPKQK